MPEWLMKLFGTASAQGSGPIHEALIARPTQWGQYEELDNYLREKYGYGIGSYEKSAGLYANQYSGESPYFVEVGGMSEQDRVRGIRERLVPELIESGYSEVVLPVNPGGYDREDEDFRRGEPLNVLQFLFGRIPGLEAEYNRQLRGR